MLDMVMEAAVQYPNQYDHYFQVYAIEFFPGNVPWPWFKAQGIAESGLDPEAMSPVGAIGVMQLMPATAQEMARRLGVPPATDVPHVNIRLGIAYARQCWNIWRNESWENRLLFMFGSYNAGPGNIITAQRFAARNGRDDRTWDAIAAELPNVTGEHARETINYVARIKRIYAALENE